MLLLAVAEVAVLVVEAREDTDSAHFQYLLAPTTLSQWAVAERLHQFSRQTERAEATLSFLASLRQAAAAAVR